MTSLPVREKTEELEAFTLSRYAVRSADSSGRRFYEPPCPIRTCFQRDRDRIIHSKAFRRLKHKTQVFIAPSLDHYRTRLTHTLEVAQISRTVARALRLNEDLTEAVALGHDLGHTPFGHAGEAILKEITPTAFRHNEQSLRVVDVLEQSLHAPQGAGLNLTFEVRDGIVHHTGDEQPATLEGQVVRICDRVAYINHDIDDSIRAGILCEDDLPGDAVAVLGTNRAERINTMVVDLICHSMDRDRIAMGEEVKQAMDKLRDFLFAHVYLGFSKKSEQEKKVKWVIKQLYGALLEQPELMPEPLPGQENDDLARRACDYIAGMTDRFILSLFRELFIPKPWVSHAGDDEA